MQLHIFNQHNGADATIADADNSDDAEVSPKRNENDHIEWQ